MEAGSESGMVESVHYTEVYVNLDTGSYRQVE